MRRELLIVIQTAVILAGAALTVQAQATRTWVSGVGDDANPCSRTAPCKTFAGAISKTAAGGEISALDPGGYGAVNITKSMTISGDGTLAGILASGTNGISINAAASDTVILRNLSLHGGVGGLSGIRYLSAKKVVVDRCTFSSFTGKNIEVSLVAEGNLVVTNSVLQGGMWGVRVESAAPTVRVSIRNTTITGAATGVHVLKGTADVADSQIVQNTGTAILAENLGIINVARSLVTGNGVAVVAGTGAAVRLIDSDFVDNLTGFGCGGGTISSVGNNRKAGNVGGGLPTCLPTPPAVTLQ